MQKLIRFFKHETVLCISFTVAVISCMIVPPDARYRTYIDARTLGILLMLMLTMSGFQKQYVFWQIGEHLVSRMRSARSVALIFLMLCFFSSMFITNDVALLTFVPFSIITLSISGREDLYIPVIVLETIAANLGSMLTPLGNPQNLYLYSLSDMSLGSFVLLMLPYSLISAILLLVFALCMVKSSGITLREMRSFSRSAKDRALIGMYVVCFVLSILVVARILPYHWILLLLVLAILVFDRSTLKMPDYSLLFTFVFLFVFIGNIKRIPALSSVLQDLVSSHEIGVSILLSQVISNVPAAILCSGFTEDLPKLIIGTNLGGLGTLIASMASLISFKQYCNVKDATVPRYLKVFTICNLLFLLVLLVVSLLLQA
ncbi:MAG: citrate transporter [Lachnospiraceae bacterium]|nr:citrate transporter [Lachnospiraceae bacterium]